MKWEEARLRMNTIFYRKEWIYRLPKWKQKNEKKTWLFSKSVVVFWLMITFLLLFVCLGIVFHTLLRYEFKMVSLELCVYALGQWLFPLCEHTNIKCAHDFVATEQPSECMYVCSSVDIRIEFFGHMKWNAFNDRIYKHVKPYKKCVSWTNETSEK